MLNQAADVLPSAPAKDGKPLSDTILPISAVAIFLVGIALLLLLLVHLIRFIRIDDRERRRLMQQRNYDAWRLSSIAVAILLIGLARMIFWTNAQLRQFSVVAVGQAVGSMHVFTSSDNLPRFIYSAYDNDGHEVIEVFPVREAGVRLDGELLRWPSFMEVLGLGTFFKATNVDFLTLDSLGNVSPKVNSNPIQLGPTVLFDRLHSMESWLPLCRTVPITTGTISSGHDFSYRLYIESDSLTLKSLP